MTNWKTCAVAAASVLFSVANSFAEEPCPTIEKGRQGNEVNTLLISINGFTGSGDLKQISRGADNWHWNARWDQTSRRTASAFDTARLTIDPGKGMITYRVETSPVREVTAEVIYSNRAGTIYVQANTSGTAPGTLPPAASCVKLPGFIPPP